MFKVLLLDDDEFANMIVKSLLETSGITAEVRTSGVEALDYLHDCTKMNSFPDVILVDLNMPDMDGITFIGLYETRYRILSPHIKIFVVTNSMFKKEKEKALEYKSVSELWSKPLTLKKIRELISKVNKD